MSRNIKMVVYGEPGVGKSTFAATAPKPFFITTDGNYEYLEDFCGLKSEDHQQCFSWAEMKKAFARDFSKYDTIVVDLLEDSYLWADTEFCRDNKLVHISDLGYGKGYSILGNDFFVEYQKLLALPKNVILLMHGVTEVLKDRRGVEYSKYGPSKLVRDKIITQIEGRVRFFVRAYAEAAEGPDGRLITKRYLSLSPDGHTEFGIARGLSSDVPRAIPLDWNSFIETIDQYTIAPTKQAMQAAPIEAAPVDLTPTTPAMAEAEAPKKRGRKAVAAKEEPAEIKEDSIDAIRAKLAAVTEKKEVVETPEIEATTEPEPAAPATEPEPVNEGAPTPTPAPAAMSQADKMAAIRAKMAALKANKKA